MRPRSGGQGGRQVAGYLLDISILTYLCRSLYKGLTPALVKAATTSSIHFTVYERVCQLFLRRHPP